MARASLALCCILKNEVSNIERLLQSVKFCFDDIHFTDTGSTDGSIELIQTINEKIKNHDTEWFGIPEIKLHHFEWVDDFAKAREYSFSHTESDYIMWMDLDDVLSDKFTFAEWRDEVMSTNHFWTATYNYAFNKKNEPICQFIRERVIKKNHGFKWTSFVHEGCVQIDGKAFWGQHASTWTINHLRSEEDIKKDKKRNLEIFDKHSREIMTPRMLYYWGKELFENQVFDKSIEKLLEASVKPELELHDRVLAIQYASQAALYLKKFPEAINIALQGLMLMPARAEYHCCVADAHFNLGNVFHALPFYESARRCVKETLGGALVTQGECYGLYPTMQLSRCYFNIGKFDEALAEVEKIKDAMPQEYNTSRKEILEAKENAKIHEGKTESADIVILCPPYQMPEWDEDKYEEVGLGGSETAVVEVTRNLKKLTSRPVKVFNVRKTSRLSPSGVEYYPLNFVTQYLRENKPSIILNWRHSTRLSKAKTFVWAHDLLTPGIESQSLDGVICLSEFHRDYAKSVQGLAKDKAVLLRNGINPEQIKASETSKIDGRIIWPSSPDRGLDRVISIIKKAREKSGINFTLDVFYGTDNMKRMGMAAQAEKLESLVEENKDWVFYYGNVDKKTLYTHWWQAQIWLYPANFIETFCISAIEALGTSTYPIVRDIGALKYTLKDAIKDGMAKMVETDIVNESDIDPWVDALIEAYETKAWEKVSVDMHKYSWEAVTREFIEKLGI